ncbi:MAG: hypothetical protein A3F18_03220 [Legionellales bacterium RIFCSPHIGHO2_12_FULL_37_14]|nr:MAG: hypothetical protein A3F18_03220 [Legionellales bacterium RIFCSPHIGHO2_12_FULL_37_14]
MKFFLKTLLFILCITLSTGAVVEPAKPSIANHLHHSPNHDPDEHGWLADLQGLPVIQEVEAFLDKVYEIIKEEVDPHCRNIDENLRAMIFQHFLIYQNLANAQGITLDDEIADQWAHMLAMILKESSGDSTEVTSMGGKSFSTYTTSTDVANWHDILELSNSRRIKLTQQTNFGLAQISDDQLYVAFNLDKSQIDDIGFLEGKEGLNSPVYVPLDTNIAVRRLIWFYQDFSQGRVDQNDFRIHRLNANNPEFAQRRKEGIEAALVYCGTHFLFRSNNKIQQQELDAKLRTAMDSIAYCSLGNPKNGYGRNVIDMQCFAEWVTLCPALNVDIALILPLRYFATRYSEPVCAKSFKKLIINKPLTLNAL